MKTIHILFAILIVCSCITIDGNTHRNLSNPNFIVILADDLGYECLNAFGGQDYSTPNLNRMASEGVRFSRAYTSPVCTPSRMSLMTGTYTSRHGHYEVLPVHLGTRKKIDFNQDYTSFAQLFRDAGYRTSVFGKWQLAALEFHPQHPKEAGYDKWFLWQIWKDGEWTSRYWNPAYNENGKPVKGIQDRFGPDVVVEKLISEMEESVTDKQPFMIHYNMLLPHFPIVKTPLDKETGKDTSLEGMIQYMDQLCGDIMDAVHDLEIEKNTWIIFVGDNGTDTDEPRQTGMGTVIGRKTDPTDAGTHIPLIFRRPGAIESGAINHDLVDMSDLFPTLCDLAGIPVPAKLPMDGISFATSLLGGTPSSRQWVTFGIGGKMSVYDGLKEVTDGDTPSTNDPTQVQLLNVLKALPRYEPVVHDDSNQITPH